LSSSAIFTTWHERNGINAIVQGKKTESLFFIYLNKLFFKIIFIVDLIASLEREMSFAQWVIGPPGSGKTTYCNGMSQFLTAMGRSHPLPLEIYPPLQNSILPSPKAQHNLPSNPVFHRKVCIINLDPANDALPYAPLAPQLRREAEVVDMGL
jgi:hypothetical protein